MAIYRTLNKRGSKQFPFYLSFSRKTNFLTGIESLMNISGNLYTIKKDLSNSFADTRAIKKDWSIVGDDLRNSINSF